MLSRRISLVAFLGVTALGCGGGDDTPPTVPSPACAYQVTPTSLSFAANGGTATVRVQTTAACAWSAATTISWVTVAPPSGIGSADVTITMAENTAAAERLAQASIAGETLSLRQDGRAQPPPCAYAISPPANTWGPEGGLGSFHVDAESHCSWTATTTDAWVTMRRGSGTGAGRVEFELAEHTGRDRREGGISVADKRFSIRQDPRPLDCAYSVNPTSAQLHWYGPGLNVQLTTGDGCPWTATSAASWLRLVTPAAGVGSIQMQIAVDNYLGHDPRTGDLQIRWPTPTAGQNVRITQDGCWYALAPADISVPAAGGRRLLTIIASAASPDSMIGCPWEVRTNVSWIHFAGATTGSGDDGKFFDVDANTTGAARTGQITIGPATVSVRQER